MKKIKTIDLGALEKAIRDCGEALKNIPQGMKPVKIPNAPVDGAKYAEFLETGSGRNHR